MQKWHHHAKDARKQLPSPGHWAATPAEGPGASPLVETDASRTLTTTRCIGRKFLLSNPTRKNTFVWLKTCENPITSTKTIKKNQKIRDEIKKVHWFLDNGSFFFSKPSWNQRDINVFGDDTDTHWFLVFPIMREWSPAWISEPRQPRPWLCRWHSPGLAGKVKLPVTSNPQYQNKLSALGKKDSR